MAACEPVESPCKNRGLTWYDWAYSIFNRICEVIQWLASIRDVSGVTPLGAFTLAPSYLSIDEPEEETTVTVPAGALEIQAVIDNEYSSTYRLTVMSGSTEILLPAGSDFHLPSITPLYDADAQGLGATRGHGAYGTTIFKFPAGSRGLVTAIYKDAALTITQDPEPA